MQIKISGLDEAIKKLEKYKLTLEKKQQLLLTRLAQVGIEKATINFGKAVYDGTNDVVVNQSPEWISENKLAISAVGDTVAFIEFGTGVVYPDDHPTAQDVGAVRGSYGQGKGFQTTWGYYGEKGTNGFTVTNKSKKEVVLTHGNPANRCLYDAGKDMREQVLQIAKEVFAND